VLHLRTSVITIKQATKNISLKVAQTTLTTSTSFLHVTFNVELDLQKVVMYQHAKYSRNVIVRTDRHTQLTLIVLPWSQAGLELDMGRFYPWVGSSRVGLGHRMSRCGWVGLGRVRCQLSSKKFTLHSFI